MATVGDVPVVQIDGGFDRAWRRVGLALDRTGFTVEDRDRSQGMYFVRYVAPKDDKKEPASWASCLAAPRRPCRHSSTASSCAARVNDHGVGSERRWGAETSANASSIVRVLAEDLK